MNSLNAECQKKKVVFIMGATGTGKSKLSIHVATAFHAEIINSDKIQVYKGLDIVTNKVTESEQQGVPHHLLGEVDPNADFTAQDFCQQTLSAIDWIIDIGRVPIVVGGSNTFIEALVEDPNINFKAKYDSCFIWLDVSLPVLYPYLSIRVDQMVRAGLVDEVRAMFVAGADYTRGIRRAIGVPEMDKFFKLEMEVDAYDEETRDNLLNAAIEEIKANTCKLASCQLEKIQRLRNEVGWFMHRIDATAVFEKACNGNSEETEDVWERVVKKPSLEIVADFLMEDEKVKVADFLKEDEKVMVADFVEEEDKEVVAPEINVFPNSLVQPLEVLKVGT